MLFIPYELDPLPNWWDTTKLSFRSYFQLFFEGAMFYYSPLVDIRSIWWFTLPAENIDRHTSLDEKLAIYYLTIWSVELDEPFDLREFYTEEKKNDYLVNNH